MCEVGDWWSSPRMGNVLQLGALPRRMSEIRPRRSSVRRRGSRHWTSHVISVTHLAGLAPHRSLGPEPTCSHDRSGQRSPRGTVPIPTSASTCRSGWPDVSWSNDNHPARLHGDTDGNTGISASAFSVERIVLERDRLNSTVRKADSGLFKTHSVVETRNHPPPHCSPQTSISLRHRPGKRRPGRTARSVGSRTTPATPAIDRFYV